MAWKIQRDGQQETLPDVEHSDTSPIQRDAEPTSTAGLLQRASAALAQQHLVAPAGDNAMEWYLRALHQEPGNRAAQDALREIFPFAATQTEQAIGQSDAAEVTRQIDLLARADPSNYTPTLLRAKLQAQQALADDQLRREQAQAANKAQRPAAVAPDAPLAAEKPAAVHPASPAPLTQAPAAASANVPASPPASAHNTAPAAEPARETAAVLVRRVEPWYPADARRSRRTGWVDVRFVVSADGSVTRASVVDADPKNVFDRAALSAVERWQFTPATRNGTPTPSELRQRIEFHL